MSDTHLSADELVALVERVFQPRESDRALAIIVDLPDEELADNPGWRTRRELASGWAAELAGARPTHGLEVDFFCYRNVRANNADLPPTAWEVAPGTTHHHCDELHGAPDRPFEEIFTNHPLVIAPTELSATAPLKMLAPRYGFRGATMPGFSPAMVAALRLDYTEIDRRVRWLKDRLDIAASAELEFIVDGADQLALRLDLRHRSAHASGGLLREPGTAGNVPSGEAYIVPYEGELEGDPSASAGLLPIQYGNEVVVFRILANRAVEVVTDGEQSKRRASELSAEPAAGNLAELGLGVLADFGIAAIGEVLLDEKLGLHVAFGRSEHFGGQVGPEQFSRPEAVIHQDHVYLPELQPKIVPDLTLGLDDGTTMELIRDGRYVIDFR